MARVDHRAGELRQRVKLQREERTADGGGGFTIVWKDVAAVWAAVSPLSGQEALFARQLQASITHKVVIRYRPGVNASHRIVFGCRVFNIREVRNIDERNWRLDLRCEEGVAT